MVNLDKYLIPANEALSDKAKESLASIGIMTVICAALGISQKLKNRKKEKEEKAKNKAIQEKHDQALKEAFDKIDKTYKLSSMSKDEYRAFLKKMYIQVENDLRKILKPLNSKEVLDRLKEDYINDVKSYYKDDPNKLKQEISYANNTFKPGLFKIYDNAGDYICITGTDQDINVICSGVIGGVADALELKYSDFCDAGLFSVGTGDGDEGSVYPDFVSYETMRKRIA